MLARHRFTVISLVLGLAGALGGCAGPDAPIEPLGVRAASLEGVVDGHEVREAEIVLDGFRNGSGAMVFTTTASNRLLVTVCDPASDPTSTDPYGSLDPSLAPTGCGQSHVMVCDELGTTCTGLGEVEAVFTGTGDGVRLEVDAFSGADTLHATIDFVER